MLRAMLGVVILTFSVQTRAQDASGPGRQAPTATALPPSAPDRIEVNTILMETTFKIMGPGTQPASQSMGTCFLLGDVDEKDSHRAFFVLVTAAHVLKGIQGEHATVILRTKDAAGKYSPLEWTLKIRDGVKPLWTQHADPSVDVAAMRVSLPNEAGKLGLVVTTDLATDRRLAELEIHPGDELRCLGFPHGVAFGPGVFPILRGGKIASYPLVPTADVKVMLFDFHVFPGNSGGPVYFVGLIVKPSGRS